MSSLKQVQHDLMAANKSQVRVRLVAEPKCSGTREVRLLFKVSCT